MKVIKYLIWLYLSSFALCVEKFRYSHEDLVVRGCKFSLAYTTKFCAGDADGPYTYWCHCTDGPAMASWMNCIYEKTHVNNTKVEEVAIDLCHEIKIDLNSTYLRDVYQNGTNYMVNSTTIPGFKFNQTILRSPTINHNETTYEGAYGTLWMLYGSFADSIYFGAGILGFWSVIILGATIVNFSHKLVFSGKYINFRPINMIRKYITMPALFPNRIHTQVFYPFSSKFPLISGLLPTRGESLVIFWYFALNIIFEGVRYHYVSNSIYFFNRNSQMGVYPGVRAGVLALYGFQLTYLFAGRNNFLMWITGWKQATFITYHKWISRFNYLLIIVHAATLHIQSEAKGEFHERLATHWYRWGIVCGVSGGIIMISAMHWVRTHYYEIFLIIHIIMAAIFLASAWIHVHEFEYTEFAYALAAIWVFDRVVRFCRLVMFGVRTANVTVVSDETLKIRISKTKYWKAYPGSYGYVHFLKPTTFLQSHPFTLVSENENEICFYTKIKGGVTSQVHSFLRNLPNQSGQINVTVEGPYGDPKPMKHYDTCLLYAGGNGIPGMYAYAKYLGEKAGKHVKLYWVIRNWNSLDWFYEELMTLKHSPVQVIIYITKPDSVLGSKFDSVSSSGSALDNEKHAGDVNNESINDSSIEEHEHPKEATPYEVVSRSLNFVEFRFGRPNVEKLIEADFKDAEGRHVAVMTCAHNSMVDDLRYYTKENLNVPKGRVDFFEELQTW